MVTFIWFFWLFNQFLIFIFGFNFLVAQINQTYEKVMSKYMSLRYNFKCKKNMETVVLLRALDRLTCMHVFILTSNCSSSSLLSSWSGLVQTLKVFIESESQEIKTKVIQKVHSLSDHLDERVLMMDDQIQQLGTKLEVVNDNIDDKINNIGLAVRDIQAIVKGMQAS